MPEAPNIKLREPLPPPVETALSPFAYAELEVTSNFSFLRGASHPDELVFRAAVLGYRAIAITDRNSLAGVVRAHDAVKQVKEQGGIAPRLVIGTRLVLVDGPEVLVYPVDRAGYGRLCRLLTLGKRRAEKGECLLYLADFLESNEGMLAVVAGDSCGTGGPPVKLSRVGSAHRVTGEGCLQRHGGQSPPYGKTKHRKTRADKNVRPTEEFTGPRLSRSVYSALREAMGDRLSLAASALYGGDDQSHLAHLAELSKAFDIPLLATNDVHYHDPSRRALQDVLTCVRHHCTMDEAGFRLFANDQRYLKSPEQMHRLFADYPRAIWRGVEVAERCEFSLDELKYEYPSELVPAGERAIDYVRRLAYAGARERYGGESDGATERRSDERDVGFASANGTCAEKTFAEANPTKADTPAAGIPEKIRNLLEHELVLIEKLKIEAYFLTVHDLVRFARSRGILCQGRGSAANSAVCYCLGVTSVDPNKVDLLFERFVSAARDEPPDIDVDFEHERREEVIQYIYEKYGRERSGMTGVVITYRGRSAVRDVGKAMGLSLDLVDQMAKKLDWWHRGTITPEMLGQLGLDAGDRTIRKVIELTSQLLGFPRHLSQHVGGMVMTRGLLCELVPIENASMEDRTVIEWDKDDIDTLGILKVDVLALGMLTCISKALGMINSRDQSDEATERRSDEGEENSRDFDKEIYETGIEGQNISGFDCVAEGEGISQIGLCGNSSDAPGRALWVDQPDAAGGDFHTFKHRGGPCPTESSGLSKIPEDFARFARRVDDTGGDFVGTEIDADRSCNCKSAGRSGPNSSGVDSQPGVEAGKRGEVRRSDGATEPRSHEGREKILPLRRSVAPSLRRFPRYQLHTIPPEDPAVYDMISDADTIGVFQIESRAQMTMLPRLRPRCFYDLVIEVAIVRPGPIQGDMVHPYLRRRNGEEVVTYPSEALRNVLQKTLGVPLFQEQAMKVAMVGAGFSAGEADQLRRAMAAWRKTGAIERFYPKIINGMLANGYTREFAEQCFNQIKGFGEYGFPESHAASFALLVYVSAWLKRYHPAAFCAALLNSLPMGFYAPAQIVRDAREHGVEVRAADVNFGGWDCTLEESDEATEARSDEGERQDTSLTNNSSDPLPSSLRRSVAPSLSHHALWGSGGPAVRLGLRLIKGFRKDFAERIERARGAGGFTSVAQFHRATGLPVHAVRRLAEADAFASLGLSRRQAVWEVLELSDEEAPLFEESDEAIKRRSDEGEKRPLSYPSSLRPSVAPSLSHHAPPASSLPRSVAPSLLPAMPLGQEVMTDYAITTLSLKKHPVALLRGHLDSLKIIPAGRLIDMPAGRWVKVAGLVLIRQRPGTASGIVFETIEDETGVANLIVRPDVFDRYRPAARHAGLLQADGYVERQGQVIHIMAKRLFDLSHLLAGYQLTSRDFH
jgi:error-prone DNA polymerase